MQLNRPLAVVTPTVDADVLAVLARADSRFTPSEVHRLIGSRSVSGVRNCLLRLVEQGVVGTERIGKADSFWLNREHLAAGAITELANLRGELLARASEHLVQWLRPPVYCALFGSAARGTMNPMSDIDLFLVRPEGGAELVEIKNWTRPSRQQVPTVVIEAKPDGSRHIKLGLASSAPTSTTVEIEADGAVTHFPLDQVVPGKARSEQVWEASVAWLIEDMHAWTGNDVRVLEMDRREVGHRLSQDDPLMAEIRRDGLRLSGAANFWGSDG